MAGNPSPIADAAKRRAVASAFKGTEVATVAERIGVTSSTIYSWAADERYGGKPGGIGKRFGLERVGKRNGAATVGLATQPKLTGKPSTAKPRAPIPTIGKCPHCGGLLTLV